MTHNFKFTSVIFVMILAVIVTLAVFTLARPNRDMMAITVTFGAAILAAAVVIAVMFARSVIKQIDGAANSIKGLSTGEDGFDWRINGNPEDDTGALEGMVSGIQSATTTLVKNNVSVKGLIESYENGLGGMQGIMSELQEIVNSLDDLLQESEAAESSGRAVAK